MKMTMRGIIMFGVYFFLVTLPLNTALIANPNNASGNLLANIIVKRFSIFLAALLLINIIIFALLVTH